MLIRDYYSDQKISEDEKKAARPTGAKNETTLIKELFEARKKYINQSIEYVKQTSGEIPFSDLYKKNILYGISINLVSSSCNSCRNDAFGKNQK